MKNFNNTLDAFGHWVNNDPDRLFLRQPFNRVYKTWTYAETNAEVRKIAAGLKSIGLKEGDHIAILSKNCAHWIMADLAIMMIGGVSIPIYPTVNSGTVNEILTHSESKALIAGKLDDWQEQKTGVPNIPIVGIEAYDVNEQYSWEKLVDENDAIEKCHDWEGNDLLTILYTSGTTGNPKGVMHKVSSFDEVAKTAIEKLKIPENVSYFSYLPMTHIAERVGIEQTGIYCGNNFTFPESLETFAEDLTNTLPYVFFGVPRIWQKFQEKVHAKVPPKKLKTLMNIPILGALIKKKIRTGMGLNKAKICVSGAAPLSKSLMLWYKKLGVKVLQGYGMTEDCILSHFNLPKQNKFGSVGKPFPQVQSRLSPEGEVQLKSNCLMLGYFKQEDLTAETFTEDGYLRTGDIGEFDHDGYLYITGRVKDQFKTDKGKYVSPAPIELEMMKSCCVEQVCVVGTGISQPIALIVPTYEGKKMAREEFDRNMIESLQDLNKNLPSHEKLAKAVIMKEDWTVDNGFMTPTLKVKRNRVEAMHQDMYSGWFNEKDIVVYEEK